MIDVSYEIAGTVPAPVPSDPAGLAGCASPSPAGAPRYHHHEWHADTGDTQWTCPCGAWVTELRTAFGSLVPLPKAIV